jgi:tetratricopeptide (TPR) repeat protein
LQRASVVGRIFWKATVDYLGIGEASPAIDGRTDVSALLDAVCARELTFPRRTSAFAQTREYIFKHALLRDVTYESVLKKERRAYHALVAEWLLERSRARAREYAGLIADHLDLAGQKERAITHLQRAAEQAAAQFANTEALHYLGRALDLSDETDYTRRYDLLLARETVYDLQGEREAQRQDLLTLAELAELSADNRMAAALQKAEVALRRAHYAEMTGDYPQSIASAMEGIKSARAAAERQIDDPGPGPTDQPIKLEATGHLRWGQALARQGEYGKAQGQLEKALTLARSIGILQVEAHGLRTLGSLCWYQDDYAGATDYFEQALALYRKIGDRRGVARTLGNLGVVPWTVGYYAKATAYFEQALRIHREIGDLSGEAVAYNNMGIVTFAQGYYEEAQRFYEQALHLQQMVGDREGEEMSLNNLGVASRSMGNYAAAKDYFERALRISRAIGIQRGQAVTLSNLGLILHNMGDYEEAEGYCRQALQIALDLGLRDLEAESLTNLGHALASRGDLAGAADVYRRAVALRRELGQSAMMMESLAGLARVTLKQGKEAEALALVEEILQYLEAETLEGAEEPFWVYQSCCHILLATHDSRAQKILEIAHTRLQEQAAKIKAEEFRRMFLENVITHREIVEAFTQSQQG